MGTPKGAVPWNAGTGQGWIDTSWGTHSAQHHHGARHTEYAKRTQAVVAEYREEVRRLKELNSALLEALKAAQTFCQQRGGSWADFEATVNAAISAATGEEA